MAAVLQAVRLRDWKGANSAAACSARPRAIKGRQTQVNWAERIERIATQRDREAFRILFEHFAPRIKGFLMKAGCSADEAEEIAQNAMIAVWRKAGTFDPATTGAGAWIFTIARNLRIDAARRAARLNRLKQSAELEVVPEPAETAEATISRAEDASGVDAALLRLPQEQSTVIRLSFLEERPHAEIAEALKIPLGTVKSRIRLALSRLKELLEDTR
jgi:RNA polymerase sigma factor (sigma-70 family)